MNYVILRIVSIYPMLETVFPQEIKNHIILISKVTISVLH